MNADRVRELAEVTLAGTRSFPEIVAGLVAEGVEYYQVDYVLLRFSFYGSGGGVVTAPLAFEALPPVGSSFDLQELRRAILDSQQNKQQYRQFCERAMRAGVQSYYACLRGKRVLYIGREGDVHVEWFPGVKPDA